MSRTKKYYIKTALKILFILVIFDALFTGYKFYTNLLIEKNHKIIRKTVEEAINFKTDTLDEQLAILDDWIGKKYVSDEDRGYLYERRSNICKFQGDTLGYYECIGDAIYYLDKAGDKDVSMNLYSDLASFYMTNLSFDRAQKVMNQAYEIASIEEIEDLQVKSHAYRIQAVLYEHAGDYEKAEEYLNLAADTNAMSHTGIFEEPYEAFIDVQLAKVYFDTQRYDEARSIIIKYKDSKFFEQKDYANILARDFMVPYYEVNSYICVYDKNTLAAQESIEQFVKYCEMYGFQKREVNTLIFLQDKMPAPAQEIRDIMNDTINKAYLLLTDIQTDEYTALIEGQFESAINNLENKEEEEKKQQGRNRMFALYTIVLLEIIGVCIVIGRNNRIDGLTKVQSRKFFNIALNRCIKHRNEYAIIMMDIDNFKHVNDTYGHQQGDKVLIRLGQILNRTKNVDICPYRYGGEEFAIIAKKHALHSVEVVAEHIRSSFAAQTWDFEEKLTISLGVATSQETSDVVKSADESLYYSKQHGKNQVTTYLQIEGKKVKN